MKNLIAFILVSITGIALAGTPIGNYQNTPPYVVGGAATTLTAGTQVLVCTGNCVNATDSKRAQMSVVTGYLNTLNGDTTFSFVDSCTTFADSTRHGRVYVTKRGYAVCGYFGSGFTGTSNAATFVFGAFPTIIRPTVAQIVPMGGVFTDSAVTGRPGHMSLGTNGVPTMSRLHYDNGVYSSVFLGSSTKAIDAGATFCYVIQ